MELSCGPPAATARPHTHDTTLASKVPPKAALRAVDAPPHDGRPGSWSDWILIMAPSWRELADEASMLESLTQLSTRRRP